MQIMHYPMNYSLVCKLSTTIKIHYGDVFLGIKCYINLAMNI